jgi:hypothetical protein
MVWVFVHNVDLSILLKKILILLYDQSQWSMFLYDFLSFHHMFLPFGFHLWTIKTFDPLNFESLSMSNPHMCMVSVY